METDVREKFLQLVAQTLFCQQNQSYQINDGRDKKEEKCRLPIKFSLRKLGNFLTPLALSIQLTLTVSLPFS